VASARDTTTRRAGETGDAAAALRQDAGEPTERSDIMRNGYRLRGGIAALGTALALALVGAAAAEEVGRVGVDWVGNDIVIEAIPDPKVQGVTCHVAYFDRSLIDRLSKGNWFEDPSNGSIACRQTGPITLGDIDKGPKGEKVFSESRSLVFKSLRVTRIYDAENQVLIYLTHANELTDGSAKMSISTVPLYGSE
jgi:CreA protein